MKVTVITVNLNGNRFLADSITSVLEQDWRDVELVIVDGGSTDGSLTTIEEAARGDNRVRWISEPDKGIADAMNKGISLAKGTVVGFLHSDDRYPDSGALSVVVEQLEANPETVWLTGGLDLIDERGERFRNLPVRRFSRKRILRANILFHPATFVRVEILRECKFDPGLRLAMDYDLWLRLAELGDPLLVDRSLACFRVHEESLSIRGAEAALAEEFAIRRRFLGKRGKTVLPFYLPYLAQRITNRFFMRGLRKASSCR